MKSGKIAISILLIITITFAILCIDIDYSKDTLHKFKSYEALKEFIQRKRDYGPYVLQSSRSAGLNALESYGYSETNIQVEGVDEADMVKTDGEYIYVISGQKVVIARAYSVEEATVLSRITVDGTLKQLFINAERLVVFYENGSWNEAQTFVNIYDISNRANPALKNEVAVDGRYFSSRMIGEYVYVVVRKTAVLIGGDLLPKIYFRGEYRAILATDIYYSDITDYGYIFTTIMAVNVLENEQEPVDETILSGWTTEIYVSKENIYLAISSGDKTVLHRIHIENGEINCVANGEVPGSVLNQFSMDEYGDYFRIASTSTITNSSAETKERLLRLQNNIYVLNMDLDIAGRLENIAPGEKIYSARFMGDTCYLVTFRKVDPLFVINLSNPYSPEILGELEITGYSDYLHLYDESHVIGVGKETVAAKEGDFSWYQGVKISFFDVTDMCNPKELATYEIGDRGTDSPVLRDHKAFLFV
jgi:uncharacterized secreted protein with C-terminal beta-propeller domain